MKKIPLEPRKTPDNVKAYYAACDEAEDNGKRKPRPDFTVIEYFNIRGYSDTFKDLDTPKGRKSNRYDTVAYTEEIRFHLGQTHPLPDSQFSVVGKYTPVYYEGTPIFQHALSVQNMSVDKAYQLYGLGRQLDLYTSICDFTSDYRRTSSYACSVSAIMLDIDYYTIPALADLTAAQLYPQIVGEVFTPLGLCPNYGIASGRGLYIVFLLDTLQLDTAEQRTAYNKVLEKLVEMTKSYGADPVCTDLARIFRLPTTRNSKTGAISQIIDFENVSSTPQQRLDLYQLANVLGVDLTPKPEQGPETAPAAPKPKSKRSKPVTYLGDKLTLQTLGRARATDLYNWLNNRRFDIEGKRNHFFMVFSDAVLSYMQPNKALPYVQSVNTKLKKPLPASEIKGIVHSAIQNTAKRKRKEKGYHNFSNTYIIRTLDINKNEMKQFLTIISREEKQRRDTERKHQQRRNEQGNTKRQQAKQDKILQVQQLHSQGKSQAQIAALMGVSRQLVSSYLKLSSEPSAE